MSNDTDLVSESSLRLQIFLDVLGEANHTRLIELIALEMERDQELEKTLIYPLSKFNPVAGTIDPSIICLDACAYNDLFSDVPVEGSDEKKPGITRDDSATSVPHTNEPVPTGLKSSGHRYNHFLNTPLAKIGTEGSVNDASVAFAFADETNKPDNILDIDVARLYKMLTAVPVPVPVPTPVQCELDLDVDVFGFKFEIDDRARHLVANHSSSSFLPDRSTRRLPEPVEGQWDKNVALCLKEMKELGFSYADEAARHLWDYHGIGKAYPIHD